MRRLDEAEQRLGRNAGTMEGSGVRKLTLHTSESDPGSIDGVVDWVLEKNIEYHLLLDEKLRRVVQLFSFDVAARSLKNGNFNGSYGCNKSGKVNIQICIVDRAKNDPFLHLSAWAQDIIEKIMNAWDIPDKVIDDHRSIATWLSKNGVYGHKNAPGNDHTDPGAIPSGFLVRLTQPDTGKRIKRMQRLLNRHLKAHTQVDGVFGAVTERNLRKFQTQQGLAVDGIAGKRTWAALRREPLRKPKPKEKPVSQGKVSRVLRTGDRGRAVRKLQRALNRVFPKRPIVVDGHFGKATRRRVKSFQRRKNLPVDGIVGRTTWHNLGYRLVRIKGQVVMASGATPPGADLMRRLRQVASFIHLTIKIISGDRTPYQAWILRMRHLNGTGNLAALCCWRTGRHSWSQCGKSPRSNHARGKAADCGVILRGRYVSIGNYRPARAAMRRFGLCLPVGGERWHAETGNRWRA